jgi:predicted small secreted protein
MIKKVIIALTASAIAFTTAACNTVQGAGKDMASAADAAVVAQQGAPLPDSTIPRNSEGFKTREDCVRALARPRQERQAKPRLPTKEYKRQMLQKAGCFESTDAKFRVVYR